MTALADYVERYALAYSKTDQPRPGAIDVHFFEVECAPDTDATTLQRLVDQHPGEFCAIDCLDGAEHSYIDVGAWIGNQGLALRFMALGAHLGLFDLLTPRRIFGDIDADLEGRLAGSGFITLRKRIQPPTGEVPP